MKVVLLNTPLNDKAFPSLGLAYIVSILNKNGHDCSMHDGANATFNEMIDFVEKENPQLVGLSMTTNYRFEVLALAKAIKEKFGCLIMLGGPHPTLMHDQVMKNYDYIDFIVRNEGEYTTLNLVNALERGEVRDNYSKILGISFRKGKEIVHNAPAPIIEDLDALPYPEWKFFDLKKYIKWSEFPFKDSPHGSIITSRGCPFRCAFCSSNNFWGYKVRFRSAQSVVDEMKYLYNTFGMKFILFNDDNFTSDRERTIEICKLILKEGLEKKVLWQCRAEVNIITEELVSWMKKAGCTMIEFGVEDCTDVGLAWINKGHRAHQVKPAFDLCKKYGIMTKSYFIVGGDFETKENIAAKKKYIEELNPDITTMATLLAYPKTKVFDLGVEKGLWTEDIWLKNLEGIEYAGNVPIYTGPNLTFSELNTASADVLFWWGRKKGYLNFGELFKNATGMIKKGEFKKLGIAVSAVIKQKLGKK